MAHIGPESSKRMAALVAAVLSMACGDDAPGAADDGASSATDGGTDAVGETTGGAGNDASSEDVTGGPDDDDESSTENGELESPYRVVFSDFVDGMVQLYTATPDFTLVEALTLPGTEDVELGSTGPQLDASGRYVAYARGNIVHAADVWTGTVETLSAGGAVAHRLQWSPSAPVLAWTTDDYILWKNEVGHLRQIVANLGGDASAPQNIHFEWSPKGDRLMIWSLPGGAATFQIRAVDADGTHLGTVCAADVGHCTAARWRADGERVVFVADVDPAYPGDELVVGERDGHEVISHPMGEVTAMTLSKDRSRAVYAAGASVFAVNVDGSGGVLVGASPEEAHLFVNDAGTWAAWNHSTALTVSPTTLYAPTVVADGCADSRTIQFEPGGARLAFECKVDTTTLWRVDGDGPARVSHDLGAGERVHHYSWAGDGLRYLVASEDGIVGVFHTATGDEPCFVPETDETALDWQESDDGQVLVVRSMREDGTGRLCAFDVSTPSLMVELGCHETGGSNTFVAITIEP